LFLKVRRAASKWAVTTDEYGPEIFPEFVSGWAYAVTASTARSLASKATEVPTLWIDDVWITGLVRLEAGIEITSWNQFYTPYTEHLECCLQVGLASIN
jgi:hypothetical protein